MVRALVLTGLLAVAPVVVLSSTAAGAQNPAPQQCADTAAKQAKRSMFGGMLNSLGGNLLGRAGVAGSVVSLALPVGSYLTDELLKKLDCKEQVQAAKATDQAVRGGVGTEVAWKSDTRPNVTGKSTVTGQEQLADGGQCLTVTDVVIVNGEETTVPKRMCKAKGASGYARV
jgi:NAD(P)-dependent dehydrogenase (short-subunit alcohol dehydrogenase family)